MRLHSLHAGVVCGVWRMYNIKSKIACRRLAYIYNLERAFLSLYVNIYSVYTHIHVSVAVRRCLAIYARSVCVCTRLCVQVTDKARLLSAREGKRKSDKDRDRECNGRLLYSLFADFYSQRPVILFSVVLLDSVHFSFI